MITKTTVIRRKISRKALGVGLSVLSVGSLLALSIIAFPGSGGALTCQGTVVDPVVGMAPTQDGQGYWIADSKGDIESCGDATAELPLSSSSGNVTAIAGEPSANGFWLVTSTGSVFPFGTATNFGDASSLKLAKGIVAMAPTGDGNGYWLLGGDGGVFSYGDATFQGSSGQVDPAKAAGGTNSFIPNKPIVGIVSTQDSNGYWMVASDGGMFAFGDAGFFGSAANINLVEPIVGMTPSSDGKGYRLVASDGGIFSYGDAKFFGSASGSSTSPVVGMAPTHDGGGYWVVNQAGNIFSYGDALNVGSTTTTTSLAGSTTSSSSTTSSTQVSSTTTSTLAPAANPTELPIGDGHVSSTPEVGYVDSCQTTFNGAGAETDGPWIDTANDTWNMTTKIAVEGSVSWPNATYSVTSSGNSRIITGNDEPIDHTTGIFPIQSSDPAYQYDKNPNSIAPQNIDWTLPLNPIPLSTPKCVPMGAIGILNDGIVLFNALDSLGRDGGAHEVFDSCWEHPDSNNELHHHIVPACVYGTLAPNMSELVGYATDGYGIYVETDSNGNMLTNSDLDSCHGRTSQVMWNGTEQDVYHYDATLEYPYTIGCFHAAPISTPGL